MKTQMDKTFVVSVSKDPIGSLYHWCIGLLPVLCLCNTPFLNISLGSVLLLLFVPYVLVQLLPRLRFYKSKVSLLPFLLLYVYIIFRAEGNAARIILCIAAVINILGATNGVIKVEKIRRIMEWFAILNTVLIVLQVLAYYGLHMRIQYIPQSIIHSDFLESYVFEIADGLYRPSALFLEPSHYSQYCCFALISALFPRKGKVDLKRAVIIAVGCILTTSGMGIMVTFGIFAWYIIFYNTSKGVKLIRILKWIPVAAVAVVIALQIPFVQTALQRVFSDVDGYNAIRGRTGNWSKAIGPMEGRDLWLGYGDSAKYPYYLAGLADTIYKYGIVGVALEFICFLYLLLKKFRNFETCYCVVFILLFCFAHLTSIYVQVFHFGVLIANVIMSEGTPAKAKALKS